MLSCIFALVLVWSTYMVSIKVPGAVSPSTPPNHSCINPWVVPSQMPYWPRPIVLCVWLQVVSTATGSGNPFEQLYRALFWLGMLLALVTALQLAALAFFMYKRARRPPLVAFPRPQLFVVMLGIPALIAAAAGEALPSPCLASDTCLGPPCLSAEGELLRASGLDVAGSFCTA